MRYRFLLFIFLISGFFAGVEAQWLSGWTHRTQITIDNSQVIGGNDLLDFPVLIDASDNMFRTIPNSGFVESSVGDDFRFTASDMTTLLDFEIESYDEVNGHLIAWIKVPVLDHNDDTEIYLYFGNSTVAAYPTPQNTWSNSYSGVWHLHNDFIDASGTGNNGTNNSTADISGKIADGQDFDGSGQYIEISQAAVPNSIFSVSMWFRYSTYPGTLFDASNLADPPNGKFFYSGSDNTNIQWYFEDVNDDDVQLSAVNSPGSTWHYLTLVGGLNNNSHEIYLDGNLIGTNTIVRAGKPNINNIRLGYSYGHALNLFGNLDGILDEVRISTLRRTGAWIRTEFNNQNSPGTFMTFGGLEQGLPQVFNMSGSGSYCNGSGGLAVQLSGSQFGVNYQLTNNGTNQGAPVTGTGGVLTWPGLTEGVYKVVATKVSSGLSNTMAGKAVIIENPLPIVTFGYSYYKTITINSAQVSGAVNLIDFPLLLSFTDSDLATIGNGGKLQSANGYDVAFTDAAGNPLKFEISQYNPATGSYTAWVKVPAVSPSANTDILMLYGKSGIASNPSSRETWSSDYVQVMHLDGDFLDATDVGNYGVNSGTSGTTGKLLSGRSFDGVNNMIVVADDPDLDGTNDEATMSLWINWVNSADGSYQRIMTSSNRGGSPNDGYEWASQPGGNHFFYPKCDNAWNNYNLGPNPFTNNTWQHLAVTLNYSTKEVKIFVNGSPMALTTINVPTFWTSLAGIDDWRWGGEPSNFAGSMDEIRVQTVERTQDWLLTEFRNQNNPSAFYSVSTENPYKPLPDVCLDDAAFVLNQARPAGGTYSGTGVSGGTFNPRIAGVGDHTITYNYTDGNGCAASGSATQTVLDLPAPTISGNSDVCPNTSGEIYNTPDIANHSYNWVITGAGASISAGQGTYEITVDWGPTSGTLTLTQTNDITGCDSTTAAFNVNVTDSEAPVIAGCPLDITQANDAGSCDAVVSWVEPTATDNCTAAGSLVWTKSHLPGATFAVGTTTVTYTARDASGNTSLVCSFDVTVTDNEAPVIAGCPLDITQANDAGSCDAVVSWVEPTATDNCTAAGSLVWTKSHLPGATFAVGTTTVTYTARDASGNTSLVCSFDVTVTDNEAPVIAGCPLDITQANDAGSCDAVVSWVEPTATDNCTAAGSLVWTKSHLPGATFAVGTTTVTYTARDASGNTSLVCSFDVTVTDNEAPVIAGCPLDITQANDAGSCDAVVSWVEPTATDNCTAAGSLVWTKSHLPGATFAVGTTTVTYTARDASGNTSLVCSFDVTVTDNEAPVIAGCPLDITQANDAGSCDAVVSWVEPTATDNCTAAGSLVWTKSHLPGATFAVGTTTVTYTARDASGNTSLVCSFDVTVTDNEAPVIAGCPLDITQANDAGSCDAVVSWVEPTATDNCTAAGSLVWTKSHLPGATFAVGTTTVTYTARDASGNTSLVCSFDVTVTDNEAPVIAGCPLDITQANDAGSCDAVVSWVEPTATDNCTAAGSLVWTKSHLPGATFAVGTTTVTYTARDASGNTSLVCSFDVTVTDNEAPVIAGCPLDITQANDAGSCDAVVSWVEPTATDNCTAAGSLVWTKSHLPGATFAVGTTTVTYTARDASGNTSLVCSFDVTVTDNEAPVIAGCPLDITQANDAGSCDAVVSWVEPTATDNCTAAGSLVWTKSHLPGATFAVGTTTVTYTARDASGNTSLVCSFDVTVTDNEAPVIAGCPLDITQANDAGSCDAVVSWVEPTATDNCTAAGSLVWTKSHLPGATFAVGTTTVTYTARDASGNTSLVCSFDVTVTDNEAPVIAGCPLDITQANDAGSCDAVVSWVEPTATDNCTAAGSLVWTKSHLPGATFAVGTTTVTYTARDASGNTSLVCSFDVTVTDNEAPVIAGCPLDITQANDAGSCDAVVSWVEPTATDNCTAAGSLVWTKSHLPGATFAVGTTTVTYTARDASGNTSLVCSFDVTVTDNEAPVIAGCPLDITQANDAGSCDAVVSWVEPTATDNCTAAGSLVWTKSHLPGATFAVGTTTVTYTARDASGNTSLVCSFDVTVTDNEAPVIAGCPLDITQANDAGSCDAVVSWVEPTATDNCTAAGSLVWTKSHLPGATFAVGTTTVTYTARDASGNTSLVCSFDVTVTDNEAPVIAGCPLDITQANDAGSCDAVVSWVEPTATDNCTAAGSLVWTKSHLPGATFAVGTTTVTYTARDASGNTSLVCSFDVTVTDNEAPVIAGCPLDITQANDAGSCDAVVSWVEPTATDNCTAAGSLVWTKSHLPGATFAVGTTTVTYTARDASGNTSLVCSFDVTVIESESPTITCPTPVTINNDVGNCSAVVNGIAPTTDDNCGVIMQTWTLTGATTGNSAGTGINDASGQTFNVGVTTVTYYIEDAAGNSAQCNFTVAVTDNELPSAICNDITVYLDSGTGLTSIIASDIDGGSTDNCGIQTLTASQTDFNCTHLGDNNVTLTVTDIYGNTSNCSAVVTVEYSTAPFITIVSSQDTLCNNGATNIQLSSNISSTQFNWIVSAHSDISGYSNGSELEPYDIDQTLTNSGDSARLVTYTITPRIYNLCNLSDEIVEIWVEPTPTVVVSPVGDTLCDGGQTDILLTSPSIPTHAVQFKYTAVPDNPGEVSGNATGEVRDLTDGQRINETLTNLGDVAQRVLYTITAYMVDDSGNEKTTCPGGSIQSEVWINPQPRIQVTAIPDTLCFDDGTGTAFTITTPNTTTGTWVYDLVTTASDAGVTGYTPTGSDLTTMNFTDLLINSTDIVQTVTYQFTPKILSPNGTTAYCENGVDTTITIRINPQPKIQVTAIPDTLCFDDGTGTAFTITTPNTTTGTWVYDLVTTASDAGVTGYTPTGSDLTTMNFTDLLINSTDIVQTVTYEFTPKILSPNGTTAYCENGVDTTITIRINPQPKIQVTAIPDTLCFDDGTGTAFTITTPNTTTGTWVYDLVTTASDAGVTGYTPTGSDLTTMNFTDLLINSTDIVQTVTYEFTPKILSPNGTTAYCENGVDTTITIRINPQPKIQVTAVPDTLCFDDGTGTAFTITTPNTTTGTWVYDLVTTASDAGVTGYTPTGSDLTTMNFTDLLINNTDIVQTVTYEFTPKILSPNGTTAYCENGVDTTITIRINPQPRIQVTAVPDTLCFDDGTGTAFTITTPNTTTGTWVYDLVTTASDAGVTGYTPTGSDLTTMNFTDLLINSTDIVQTVTYQFTPKILSPNGTTAYCENGVDTTITIRINPQPKIQVTAVPDTLCFDDGTGTAFTITTPNTTTGTWVYDLVTTASDAGVTGYTPTGSDLTTMNFTDLLINSTDIVQTVTYEFTPKILSPNGTTAYCENGVDTTITIRINPQPKIQVTAVPDTLCFDDGTGTAFTITTPNTTTGTWVYDLVTTASDAGVTGYTPTGSDLTTMNFTDLLINSTDIVQTVTYEFTPKILSPNGTTAYCENGVDTTITIRINPQPRIQVTAVPDTLCFDDGTGTAFTITTPNTTTGTWVYDLVTTASDAGVTGYTPTGSDLTTMNFTDLLINSTDIVQTVTYEFTPKILSPNGTTAYCENGVDTTITIRINPQPRIQVTAVPDTLCFDDGTGTAFTITTPNTTTGTWVYDLVTTASDAGVTGYTPTGSDLTVMNFTDLLINSTDIVQTVTYQFTPKILSPNGTTAYCENGVDTTITIRINPQPKIQVTAVPDTLCFDDGTGTAFTITTPNTTTGTWVYDLVTTASDAGVTGYTPTGSDLTTMNFTDLLINSTDIVQTVTYEFTPKILSPNGTTAYCENGVDTTITIRINPQPRIQVTAVPDTLCFDDGTGTAFTITTPNTTTGTWVYDLVTTASDAGVTGYTPTGSDLTTMNFTDLLINSTDIVQTVTYQFTPKILSPNGTTAYCENGVDTTITIRINPQPRIQVTAIPDTLCFDDGTGTAFTITTPNTTTGTWVYDLVTTASDAGVTGYTPTGSDLTTMNFTDLLINNTDIVQTVTYEFTPKILSPNGTTAYCENGVDTTITIWINPQPKIDVVASSDTICNNDGIGTSFTILTPNTTTGTWVYDLVTMASDAGVTGYTPTGSDLTVLNFTDLLINSTDVVQTVTYQFTPKILSPNGSTAYCENGVDTTIVIWINPTPRVEIDATSEICNDIITDIQLTTPSVLTSGQVTFDYTAVPSGNPGDITGFSTSSGLIDGEFISDPLTNNTDTLQTVTYYITPRAQSIGCADGLTQNVVVTVHPNTITRIDILENVSCYGYDDGKLEVILAKGTSPFDITWYGGPGWDDYEIKDVTLIDTLISGSYAVRVVDNLGCSNTDTEFINEPSGIPLSVVSVPGYDISCVGGSDGVIGIGIGNTGNYPPFAYTVEDSIGNNIDTGILNPGDSHPIIGLSKGTYKVTVQDDEGCLEIDYETLTEPDSIRFEMVPTIATPPYNISCNGYNDGNINLTNVTGGNGGYTYLWSSSDGSFVDPLDAMNQTNLTAGTFQVTVTDTKGCIGIDSLMLIEPDGIVLDDTIISEFNGYEISCNGSNDGTISLILTGGSGDYYFEWTTVDGSGLVTAQQDQTDLTAGTYEVRVWDDSNCEKIWSFILTEPAALIVNDSLSLSDDGAYNINCAGSNEGAIYLNPTGGVSPYIYTWSTSNGSGIVEGAEDQITLTAGDYHVELSDQNGCLVEMDFTLTEPEPLSTIITDTQISCISSPAFNDGTASVAVNGGIGPYAFNWSNGATTNSISGLTEDWYVVTVSDANNCIILDSVWISNPPPLDISAMVSDYNGMNISCAGAADGEISVEPTGTAPFIYSWTIISGSGIDDPSAKDQTGLTAGDYQLHVVDANQCTGDTVIRLVEPEPISVIVQKSNAPNGDNISCYGENSGSIDLTIAGGVSTYAVQWQDGVTGNSRNGLFAGDYPVHIEDANGCSLDTTIQITQPDILSITSSVRKSYCPDMQDGEIVLSVQGGAGGYQYLWSTGSTNSELFNIPAGEYLVEVIDINNCYVYDTIEVTSVHSQCLDIPTGFSPNGDGINDKWQIGLIELYPDVVIEIFNRWGEMVFRSERGYPDQWDGVYRGRPLPIDSYHYVIELNDGKSQIIGNVTIVK